MRLLLLLVFILALPFFTMAAPSSFKELTDQVLKILNAGITTVLILGLVIYFYGVSTSVSKYTTGTISGTEIEKFRVHVAWGVVALFVMVSVWGILALVQNTVFSSGIDASGNPDGSAACVGFSDCILGGKK